MRRIFFVSLLSISFLITLCSTVVNQDFPVNENSSQLEFFTFAKNPLWSDEFDIDGEPNSDFWDYDLGGDGWGNNEKQMYTRDTVNVRVRAGNLIIEAHKNDGEPNYTSARLVSRKKKEILYGRLEIKALLPKGRGTWPAIWMLAADKNYGKDYWPDNGEIDIMEHVGMDQGRVHSNIHTKSFNHILGTNKGNDKLVSKVSEEFHLYRLDWYPDSMQFFIDDELLFKFDRNPGYEWAEWPFDKPQYLLMNIAVGGNWGGQQGIDENVFPQKMLIDYVRYYDFVKITN